MGGFLQRRRRRTAARRFLCWAQLPRLAVAACLIAFVSSFAAEPRAADLVDLTLEQLSNIEVTSVSRHAERLSDAAASIYVISADDIRRSGANSIPEALRLAPNLQVARADNNQWAITARGFNGVLTNKMLVLIDGRTVYSPLFSGVFWEAQDVMMEDVERIEVISGPGGTQWGSNAVNGVINVITRSSRDTQGSLAMAGGGNIDQRAAYRYGGELAGGGNYRVYGRYFDSPHTNRADGSTSVGDAGARGQVGFRSDFSRNSNNFTIQGDAYQSEADQVATTRRLYGANLQGRWTRDLGGGSDIYLQSYVDHTHRDQPGAIDDSSTTFDIEFHYGLRPTSRQRLLWGAGYRYTADRVDNINLPLLAFLPANRDLTLANVFVQDEIALRRDLVLTLGLKFEHNNYTGLEYLPNARLAWKARENHLLWSSLSRTVRTPARVDRDAFSPGTPPFLFAAGGPDFRSEIANVAELGYRGQPVAALSYSVTAFHHYFSRLRSLEPSPAGPVFDNKIDGTTDGVEAWAAYRVTDWWRLSAGLTQQRIRLRVEPGGVGLPAGNIAALGNDPSHWWVARSSFDLGRNYEFDLMARGVGQLPNPVVPAYTAFDARLGWKVRRDLEISLTAQNLFDPRHAEWGAPVVRPEFERGLFLKVLWRQ
jgi:iron complex outermembrane receptor protein